LVQFNDDKGRGYPSDWPGWAFELAKAALLSDKRVWVFANGAPHGDNLVRVLLLGPEEDEAG
jgi:hypothetical protein